MGRGLDDLARTTQLPVLAEFPPVAGRRRLPPEAASYLRKPVLGAEYGLDPSHTSTASDTWSDPKGATPTRITLSRDVAFDVLPSFVAAPNPTESLSNRARGLHHHLAPHDDVIVIDSAPVLPVADALTVAAHATGVVFAVSMPDADRRQVASAIELLRRVGIARAGHRRHQPG